MSLAQHSLNVAFNPLLSNPPAASRDSIAAQHAAAAAPVPVAAPAPVHVAAPAPEPEKPAAKKGWTASAARPNAHPKKNTSQMAAAAKAAKVLAANNNRLQGSASASSLTLSDFPRPGQAMAMAMRPPLMRSKSAREDPADDSDASSTKGLGIHPSRSLAQLSNVSAPSRSSPRRPSFGSTGSSGNSKMGNSLGDGVGFTFKGTTNFVHPNRQTPRTYTPLSRSQNTSAMSLTYEDEDDDVMVERMNSVTSDGGWKSGWSVGGGSLSGPSTGPDGEPLEGEAQAEDLAPEDVHETILEECDEELDPYNDGDQSPGRGLSPIRAPSPLRTRSPARTISPSRHAAANTDNSSTSSTSSSRTGRSLKSRKSSLSIRLRARADEIDTANSSAPTSPIRHSLDKAVGIFARGDKDVFAEDAASRRASIAAARLAFEEKEAAKDRKHAEREAKREIRRRASEAGSGWKRRASNAVDSAFDSAEEKSPTYPASHGRSASIARAGSIARSNSISFFSRPITPAGADDESCDPLARVEEQDSVTEDPHFPVYEESVQVDHSMFGAAYQEEPSFYADYQQPQQPFYQQEEEASSALFPPMRSAMVDEMVTQGGLFPPAAQDGPQIYNVGGKMFDEYGMPVHQIILPSARRAEEQEGAYDSRGRRQSVTKQAKGKFNKFSAWGKTRLLRV